jgi:long-chain acyl-CoA synthetase
MTTLLREIKTKTTEINSIGELWQIYAGKYADIKVVVDKYNDYDYSYKEFYEKIKLFTGGLQYLGLQNGEHVCLFSENSAKWLLSDQSVMLAGGVDAVRGSAAPSEELDYILEHSDSIGLIAENLSVLQKLNQNKLAELKFIIVFSDEDISGYNNVYKVEDILALGEQHEYEPVKIDKESLATIIYTSGTTGKPKGVMLSHKNLLSQIKNLKSRIIFGRKDKFLSVLPTWHAYERTVEYYILSNGATIYYTNLINLKTDIKKVKPDFFVSVPRIWEAFYTGIHTELAKQPQKKQRFIKNCLKISENYIKSKRLATNYDVFNQNPDLLIRLNAVINAIMLYPLHILADKMVYGKIRQAFGGNLRQGITGGGAIAKHLDMFYEVLGINVVNGYGMTETSPILAVNSLEGNLRGSVGRPIDETEIKISKDGVVFARGPQVMTGYYKNPDETAKILSSDGWINTGDIGWLADNGELVLTGRAKDIIVLSNGENIEPQPIEDACLTSPYIDQIMLVGQDEAALGALVIPNSENILNWAQNNNLSCDISDIEKKPEIQKLFKQELAECVQSRPNYRPFERIHNFKLLTEPFSVDNGLMTQTMKLRKHEIQKRYEPLIKEMFR